MDFRKLLVSNLEVKSFSFQNVRIKSCIRHSLGKYAIKTKDYSIFNQKVKTKLKKFRIGKAINV